MHSLDGVLSQLRIFLRKSELVSLKHQRVVRRSTFVIRFTAPDMAVSSFAQLGSKSEAQAVY